MVALTWGPGVSPRYENGVDKGVVYIGSAPGVSWTGLITVNHNYDGSDVTALYLDGSKYWDSMQPKQFKAVVSAFSAPKEFMPCYGYGIVANGLILTGQVRTQFGLSYRTLLGSGGYKIHLIYNATATPTKRSYKTVSDQPDVANLEWSIAAVPPASTTYRPTAHLVIDSTRVPSEKLTSLENLLYGTAVANASLPTQAAVITLLS